MSQSACDILSHGQRRRAVFIVAPPREAIMKRDHKELVRRFSTLGALVASVFAAGAARAALVEGGLSNFNTNQTFELAASNGLAGPNRQMILNNLDFIDRVDVVVAGPFTGTSGTVSVQLRDGC